MKHIFFALALTLSFPALALEVPLAVPPLTGPVMDNANMITNEAELSAQISALYKNGEGPQVAILIIKSLEGESLEAYTIRVAETWALGNKQRDDGVLLFIALEDKKMRIEVGQGLEGSLTDLQSKRIIDNMVPYLRSGKFNAAVDVALRQIIQTISNPGAVQETTEVVNTPLSSEEQAQVDMIVTMGFVVVGVFLFYLLVNAFFSRRLKQLQSLLYVETNSLEELTSSDERHQKNISKYKQQIKETEDRYKSSITDLTKDTQKKYQDEITKNKSLESKLSNLRQEDFRSPLSKLELLQSQKRNLDHRIKVSQTNISEYQSVLKGGK